MESKLSPEEENELYIVLTRPLPGRVTSGPKAMEDVLKVLNAEPCGTDAKLQYLLDTFAGYRAAPDVSNPNSPGSAKAEAWDFGRELKRSDHGRE